MKRALLLLIIIIAAVSLVISLTGSNDTVLLIPLDSRPVNTQYAQLLGEMVNVKVILPDATLLDSYRKPAQTAKLMDWLEQSAPEADRILIASNELFNGGLMASREARSYQDLAGQWEKLRSFLRKNKKKDIRMLYILPRQLPSQFTALWEHQEKLVRWSSLTDRLDQSRESSEKAAWQAEVLLLEKEIPQEILAEYKAVYRQAEVMAEDLAELAKTGLIDELVIGLDDAEPYGLSSGIFRKFAVKTDGMKSKVQTIHGADDLTMLILAKMVCGSGEKRVFQVIWSNPEDTNKVFPYEGAAAQEILEERVAYLGGRTGEDGAFKIIIHSRPIDENTSFQHIKESWRLGTGVNQITGLADIAYTNQADPRLLELLGPDKIYDKVDVYAGWNTASNSIGTVLAHTVFLHRCQQKYAEETDNLAYHEHFQVLRVIDDYLFQAVVDKVFNDWAVEQGIDINDFGEHWSEANDKLAELMAPFLRELTYENYGVVFPWPRSFEIRVETPEMCAR